MSQVLDNRGLGLLDRVRVGMVPARPIEMGAGCGLVLICGPCVMESRDHTLFMAESIRDVAVKVGLPFVFKSSYDKANRTSVRGFRGLGEQEGLNILAEVKASLGIPVVTDIHTADEAMSASEVVDLLQIPAFLCRQTDILLAAGQTGMPVMIKKGQFLAPEDMRYAAEKVQHGGSNGVVLCERGSCFGYRELVVDFRSLSIMREVGCPVVFDATHSVQVMGGAGGSSGGNRRFVSALARAAVSVGIDGVFLECHDNPDSAPSDGLNMVSLSELSSLISDLRAIDRISFQTC